jgi:hypothetical protein
VDRCGLSGSDAAFVDIGSGRGKVLAVAGAMVPCSTLFGVELIPTNHELAHVALKKTLPHMQGTPHVGLLCKDASALTTLAPFTVVYSFSFGMPVALIRSIVRIAEESPTVHHMVLSFQCRVLLADIRGKHELVAQFTGRKEAQGGRCYPVSSVYVTVCV